MNVYIVDFEIDGGSGLASLCNSSQPNRKIFKGKIGCSIKQYLAQEYKMILYWKMANFKVILLCYFNCRRQKSLKSNIVVKREANPQGRSKDNIKSYSRKKFNSHLRIWCSGSGQDQSINPLALEMYV